MTDRELLELAAEAAQLQVRPHPNRNRMNDLHFVLDRDNWNPLANDGDALRLAVKLNLDIGFTSLPDGPVVEVLCSWADQPHCESQDLGKDAAAATRRAIVRAAAAIARSGDGSPASKVTRLDEQEQGGSSIGLGAEGEQ